MTKGNRFYHPSSARKTKRSNVAKSAARSRARAKKTGKNEDFWRENDPKTGRIDDSRAMDADSDTSPPILFGSSSPDTQDDIIGSRVREVTGKVGRENAGSGRASETSHRDATDADSDFDSVSSSSLKARFPEKDGRNSREIVQDLNDWLSEDSGLSNTRDASSDKPRGDEKKEKTEKNNQTRNEMTNAATQEKDIFSAETEMKDKVAEDEEGEEKKLEKNLKKLEMTENSLMEVEQVSQDLEEHFIGKTIMEGDTKPNLKTCNSHNPSQGMHKFFLIQCPTPTQARNQPQIHPSSWQSVMSQNPSR